MRMRRTHDARIGLAWQAENVGVTAAARQQSRILTPWNGFSDALRGKRLTRTQERHQTLAGLRTAQTGVLRTM